MKNFIVKATILSGIARKVIQKIYLAEDEAQAIALLQEEEKGEIVEISISVLPNV